MGVGIDGWDEDGKTLYRIIRGCLKAIDPSHWKEDQQRYWEIHPDNTSIKSKRKLRERQNADEADTAPVGGTTQKM